MSQKRTSRSISNLNKRKLKGTYYFIWLQLLFILAVNFLSLKESYSAIFLNTLEQYELRISTYENAMRGR